MRTRNALTILLLLTVTSLPSFAQRQWGRHEKPRSGACFYRHANFGGDYFCIQSGERWDALPRDMNNEISSINVYGGASVEIFRHENFSGKHQVVDRDVPNLREWNDRISSIRVFGGRDDWGGGNRPGWQWGRGPRPRAGACFYRHANFGGDYFCIQSGERWDALPRDMNNEISSINVYGGASVRIFRHENFSGKNLVVDRDVPNLRQWNDRISSIQVFGGRDDWGGGNRPGWQWGRGPRPRAGACFYRHANFGGDYFCIQSGERWDALPHDMNNEISSINVYGGASVEIFRHENFSGKNLVVDRDVPNLRKWNDRISSIRVFGGRHSRD